MKESFCRPSDVLVRRKIISPQRSILSPKYEMLLRDDDGKKRSPVAQHGEHIGPAVKVSRSTSGNATNEVKQRLTKSPRKARGPRHPRQYR